VREEDGEVRVVIGELIAGAAPGGSWPSYSFPTRDAIDEQLRRAWINSGGDPQVPDQWAPGDDWRSHARKLRAGIRERGGRA
jgi:hypothetical protein